MVLRLNATLTIENLRDYPLEIVDKLRGLLAAGALAHADPRHKNFYELESRSQSFYIHVCPDRGKVLLLAAWHKDCPAAT